MHPEADLHTLIHLEGDPVAWVERYGRSAPPVPGNTDLRPVKVVMRIDGVYRS